MIQLSFGTSVGALGSLFLLLSSSVDDPDVGLVDFHDLLRIVLFGLESTSNLSQNEGATFAGFNLVLNCVVLNLLRDYLVNINIKVSDVRNQVVVECCSDVSFIAGLIILQPCFLILSSGRCDRNRFALTNWRVTHLEHVEILEGGLGDADLALRIILNVLNEGVVIGIIMLHHENLARFIDQLLVGIFHLLLFCLVLFFHQLVFLDLRRTLVHFFQFIKA